MPKKIDLTGRRYSELVVVRFHGRNERKKKLWLCQCDCGNTAIVMGDCLRSNNTKSCGCRQIRKVIEKNKASATRDCLSNTRTGRCWGAMMWRCYNKKASCYASYGGRGITVCESLRSSPAALIALIGERPHGRFSIDRIKNSQGYHCGMCAECLKNKWELNIRWATDTQQARNHTNNINITVNGVTRCASEWASIVGIHKDTIWRRVRKGITGPEAISKGVVRKQ